MLAWQVAHPGPMDTGPLELVEVPEPDPGPGQVRVRVRTCGVCRTDLHVAEGDLPVHRPRVVPGHEVVGVVDALGPGANRFRIGDRVGVAWLATTCGTCRFCRRGAENLCPRATFTGWDHDGGYAEATVADERFIYRLPDELSDEQAAPLLCAGIIGYRALRAARVPPAGRLAIYGFGGSAHITAQIALAEGTEVYVATRSAEAQALASSLGAVWVGGATDPPPVPIDGAILFAPVGDLVPTALAALDRGATLAIAGIHLSDIPTLTYQTHLFEERSVRSVTANTRADGEELLRLAPRVGVVATTTPYPLGRAADALSDLAGDRLVGAAVLALSDQPEHPLGGDTGEDGPVRSGGTMSEPPIKRTHADDFAQDFGTRRDDLCGRDDLYRSDHRGDRGPEDPKERHLCSLGVQWVVNAYLLAVTAFFAFGGRLADTVGHAAMVVIGIIVFTGVSAMCGLTPANSAAEARIITFRIV
jgi:alcohol dehydrogenase, propanol-preferring